MCAWTQDGNELNVDQNEGAGYSNISMGYSIPYVAWVESGAPGAGIKGYVKRFVEGNWQQVGNYLNIDVDQHLANVDIAVLNATPYATWEEASDPRQIYVKYYNGSSWVRVGLGSLNNNIFQPAALPSIAFDGATPYVAWQENSGGINTEKIYVKYYDWSAPLGVHPCSWTTLA